MIARMPGQRAERVTVHASNAVPRRSLATSSRNATRSGSRWWTATESITYAALFRRAAGLARRLIEAGVRPGDPVASWVRNGIPAVWTGYGITLSGAAELSMNAGLSEADRRHCLRLADARHVVCAAGDAGFFEALGLQVIALESVAEQKMGGFPQVAVGWLGADRLHLRHHRLAEGHRHQPIRPLAGQPAATRVHAAQARPRQPAVC